MYTQQSLFWKMYSNVFQGKKYYFPPFFCMLVAPHDLADKSFTTLISSFVNFFLELLVIHYFKLINKVFLLRI